MRKRLTYAFLPALAAVLFVSLFSRCNNHSDFIPSRFAIRISDDPKGLHPYNTTDSDSRMMRNLMFQPLLGLDYYNFNLVPVLVDALPTVEELPEGHSKMWFTLRKDAVWDNGSPVTVADIVFSFKAALCPTTQDPNLKGGLDYIESIEVDSKNDKRFAIVCKKPYMEREAALTDVYILPQYVYDAEHLLDKYSVAQLAPDTSSAATAAPDLIKFGNTFNSNHFIREVVSGSGAYSFNRWETAQRVVLSLKPSWWGHRYREANHWFHAYPTEIVFEVIKDNNTALIALKSGMIDAMQQIPFRDFVEDMSVNNDFKNNFNMFTPDVVQIYYIGIHEKKAALSDLNTRKALSLLMDVDQYARNSFYGLATRLNGAVPQCFPSLYDPSAPLVPHDPAQAARLLAEAGWKDTDNDGVLDKVIAGKRTKCSFEIVYPVANPMFEAAAKMLQQECANAGVEIILKGLEKAEILSRLPKHEFDLCILGRNLAPDWGDPYQVYHTASYTTNSSNYVGFGNASTDSLVQYIRTETNDAKRVQAMRKLDRMVSEDYCYIYLINPKNRIAVNKKFVEPKMSSYTPGFWIPDMKAK